MINLWIVSSVMDENYLVLAWISLCPNCGWSCAASIYLLATGVSFIMCVEMYVLCPFADGFSVLHTHCKSNSFILYITSLFMCVENIFFQIITCFFFPLPYLRYLVSYKNVLTAYKSNLSFFLLHAFCIWCIVQPLRLKKHL